MPPKAKQKEGKKAQAAKKDKIVEDKTFGLKNKNKSKVVQKFVQNVEKNIKNTSVAEKRAAEKKQQKQLRIQQEQELKALFSEALSINVKKSDLRKKKPPSEHAPVSSGGGGGKASDHYDDAWAEAELAKAGIDGLDATALTLEQRIEKQREEMRAKGIKGTPVTAETFAAWKLRKAQRQQAEREALFKAEQLKKKKGASVLSGKDLFAIDQSLFVDDAEATDDAGYERREDDPPVDDDAPPQEDQDDPSEEITERPPPPPPAPPREEPVAVPPTGVGDASLYLDGDDDLDDLDDLDDD